MSISSIGGSSGLSASALMQTKRKPKDMSLDDLTKLDDQKKANGEDTTDLDKIISNFSTLDTDSSGKVSMDEVKAGAEALGINVPQPPGSGGDDPSGAIGSGPPPGPPPNGPPPSDDASSTSDASSATKKTYDKLDTNKDGVVSLQEELAGVEAALNNVLKQLTASTSDSASSASSGTSTIVSSTNTTASASTDASTNTSNGVASTDAKQSQGLTKDQLTKIADKLKADGKDTTDLSKIVNNFDKLDTDGDGKMSFGELQSGADSIGVKIHGTNAHKHFGPPPALMQDVAGSDASDSTTATGSVKNQLLSQKIQSYLMSDPSSTDAESSATSGLSIAA